MQEIHAKLLISRLSLVQNIFYHYIHGMKRLIIPIICMLLSLAGCHERKPLPSLEFADSLLTDAGDKSGALRIFLQIEEQLQSRQDPYNKGLLYERIGSIYYGQMNYVRAYHYFKQARENFQVSDSLRKETEATFDMAASSYRQKDLERAIRLYSAALDLADEQADERLAGAALSNLASLYVKSGRKQIGQKTNPPGPAATHRTVGTQGIPLQRTHHGGRPAPQTPYGQRAPLPATGRGARQ